MNDEDLIAPEQVQIKERRRHTLPHNCSTICAGGLNYSVRDGKR